MKIACLYGTISEISLSHVKFCSGCIKRIMRQSCALNVSACWNISFVDYQN